MEIEKTIFQKRRFFWQHPLVNKTTTEAMPAPGCIGQLCSVVQTTDNFHTEQAWNSVKFFRNQKAANYGVPQKF